MRAVNKAIPGILSPKQSVTCPVTGVNSSSPVIHPEKSATRVVRLSKSDCQVALIHVRGTDGITLGHKTRPKRSRS